MFSWIRILEFFKRIKFDLVEVQSRRVRVFQKKMPKCLRFAGTSRDNSTGNVALWTKMRLGGSSYAPRRPKSKAKEIDSGGGQKSRNRRIIFRRMSWNETMESVKLFVFFMGWGGGGVGIKGGQKKCKSRYLRTHVDDVEIFQFTRPMPIRRNVIDFWLAIHLPSQRLSRDLCCIGSAYVSFPVGWVNWLFCAWVEKQA